MESSLGSHFFHNVTSMNIGYLTVPARGGPSRVDWDWLSALEPRRRTAHCVWTSLAEPLEILMDGRKSRAIVRKAVDRRSGEGPFGPGDPSESTCE